MKKVNYPIWVILPPGREPMV